MNIEAFEQIAESEYQETYDRLIEEYRGQICLENDFSLDEIQLVAGIDLAYWMEGDISAAVCCICVFEYQTGKMVEKVHLKGQITVPYMPGYLAFRELPLILETYQKLERDPDLILFDGNGYLHYKNMGIATVASFYLNKPTIGVAKSYLKVDHTEFTMPDNKDGAYTDIVVRGRIFGRALRTHKDVKPIFVSCGNRIDLDTAVQVVLHLITPESRQPLPVRYADIETRLQRTRLCEESAT